SVRGNVSMFARTTRYCSFNTPEPGPRFRRGLEIRTLCAIVNQAERLDRVWHARHPERHHGRTFRRATAPSTAKLSLDIAVRQRAHSNKLSRLNEFDRAFQNGPAAGRSATAHAIQTLLRIRRHWAARWHTVKRGVGEMRSRHELVRRYIVEATQGDS